MFLPTGTLLYQQIHFQVVNKGFLWHLAKVQSRTIQGSVHSLSTCNNTVQFFVHSTTVLRNKLCVHIFVWIGVSFICKILNCHISTLPWKEIFSTTYTYQESSNMQELHFSSVADVHTTTGVHFYVSSTNLEMSVLSENEPVIEWRCPPELGCQGTFCSSKQQNWSRSTLYTCLHQL